MQTATVEFTASSEELQSLGPAQAKVFLQQKALGQRRELDAFLSSMHYNELALRYSVQLHVVWPGTTAALSLIGSKDMYADALVLVRQLGLQSRVVLRTTLEYEVLTQY